MRFIPATHMGSGEVCVESTANGGVSGSFLSGSETYNFHEFTSSNNNTTTGFQFEITNGFTQRARIIVVAGGGAGGETGAGGTYHSGGGGGGGQVLDIKNVNLFPNQIYQIQVGKGGDAAIPNRPVNPIYNGGDGDSSRFYFGDLDITAQGGEGGYGTGLVVGDGGDSGAGFTGGNGNSNDGAGGAGNTANGQNPPRSQEGGDGGNGTTLVLGYTSPAFGASTVGVGGGGGGGSTFANTSDRGIGADGGGDGSHLSNQSEDGDRHTGGGGGGGQSVTRPSPPPYSEGSEGGDGIVIVMYPTGSC